MSKKSMGKRLSAAAAAGIMAFGCFFTCMGTACIVNAAESAVTNDAAAETSGTSDSQSIVVEGISDAENGSTAGTASGGSSGGGVLAGTGTGNGNEETDAESGTVVIADTEKMNLSFDDFIKDLQEAIKARTEVLQETSENEEKAFAVKCAQTEWEIMGKYADVTEFSDSEEKYGEEEEINMEYLRREYMDGLGMQHDLTGGESEVEFWTTWQEGYEKRANVLMELMFIYGDAYGIEFPDEAAAQVKESTGGYYAESRESGQERSEPYHIQALLFAMGALDNESEIDGYPGSATMAALKQQEEALGMSVNGVINQELIDEMVQVLQDKGQKDVIEAANSALAKQELTTINISE